MSGFKPYPAYKDSGVEWLGEVPEHWALKRLGHYFEERRERASDTEFEPLSVTKLGIVPRLESAAKTQDGDNRKKVLAGDFVINSRSDRKGSSGLSPLDGSVSLICTVLIPTGLHGPYIHHLLRSEPFQEEYYRWGKGIVADLWSTNFSDMKNIVLGVPSEEEQTQIARFLDHETARIDALIEEQQRLIELLKEKRQAVISHAVTKGLDPTVPMKDSCVEWLGEVPAHWVVMQLSRTLEKVEQGWSPNASNEPAAPDKWGVIKISAIKKGVFVGSENKALLEDTRPELAFEIRDGDVLITRANTPDLVGDACVVRNDSGSRLMLSDLAYRLRLGPGIDAGFICYFLLSHLGRAQIKSDARGSSMSMAKISQGHIKAWLLALPSYSEQVQISKFISDEIGKHDELIRVATESHTLLAERRSALISAAVTGKIDVRGWQPPASASQQQSEALEA